MNDIKSNEQKETGCEALENNLCKYIQDLIKSISLNLDGNEKKLTELPFYCIHMILQKNIYEVAIKHIVYNYELDIKDFEDLVCNHTDTDKHKSYIENYKNNKLNNFTLKRIDFNESTSNNNRSALDKLTMYTNSLVDYIYESSICDAISELSLADTISLDGVLYLDSIAEAALLDIDSYDTGNSANNKKLSNSRYKNFIETDIKARQEIFEEANDYFNTIYNEIKNIFPHKFMIPILESVFIALLKIEFSHNLFQAVTDTKNKFKNFHDIKINDSDIASLMNISATTFSTYGSRIFPSVDGLYKLSDIVDTSCDKLLGKITQDNVNEEYLYNRYGLDSSTLSHLEQLKQQSDMLKSNYMDFINKGLNLCFKSLQWIVPLPPSSKYYITFTDDEISGITELYTKGTELVSDDSIDFDISSGFLHKKQEGIDVKYTRTQTIIKKGSTLISKGRFTDIYTINEKKIKHKKNDSRLYIEHKDIVNVIFIEDFDGKELDFEKHLNAYRCHIIGNEETDFLSPILRFLDVKLDTRILSMTKKDLDFMYESCEDLEDLPDIEMFLQEVETNYGYTDYESDTLHLMEFVDKLRKYKEHLKSNI